MIGEDEFARLIAAERRQDRMAGRAFARACAAGDVDAMLAAVDLINETSVDGWRLAMRAVGRMWSVSPAIRAAFLPVWIESKDLPLRTGHRPTLARALRVLMEDTYRGGPLRLYRGAGGRERRTGTYGFSWSTRRDVARSFAERWQRSPNGGVLLSCFVQPSAILMRREDEGYYDEGEVVVDPFQLGRVTLLDRLESPA